jgi:hypothetical protein
MFYTVQTYDVTYYWTEDNGVYLGNGTYVDGTEYANNADFYATAGGKQETITLEFNQTYSPKVVSLVGYDFNGWFAVGSEFDMTHATIKSFTNIYLDLSNSLYSYYADKFNDVDDRSDLHYRVNNHNTLVADRYSDEQIDDGLYYKQDFTTGSTFVFRFTEDIKLYAKYTQKTYDIHFMNAEDNRVGYANNGSAYYEENSITIEYNDRIWIEDVGSKENHKIYIYDVSTNDQYASPVQANILTYEYDFLIGYDFKGYQVSFETLSSALAGVTDRYQSGDMYNNGDTRYKQNYQIDREKNDTDYPNKYFFFRTFLRYLNGIFKRFWNIWKQFKHFFISF